MALSSSRSTSRSAIPVPCNKGVAASTGELILFLNNDIEVVAADWLDVLVRQTLLPGVGVAGARLLYPDGGIQHAGVAIGPFTLCAHVFRLADEHGWGIFGSPGVTRNWLGVTGACQMIRRSVYDRVGGKDERFILAYSDIKLSLDVWRAGYRIVYAAASTLIHHEGASRGRPHAAGRPGAHGPEHAGTRIQEDPYLHPELAALSFIPRLPFDDEPKTDSEFLNHNIERIVGTSATTPSGDLDIFDDCIVTAHARQPPNDHLLAGEPAELVADVTLAARFAINLLRSRSDLRVRFPRALSDGKHGEFADWLKLEGPGRLGCPADFPAALDAAFARHFGEAALQIVLQDRDLQDRQPLFLLPPGRPDLLQALFSEVASRRLSGRRRGGFCSSARKIRPPGSSERVS